MWRPVPRLISLFRIISLYLVLIFIPQSLWLHSSSLKHRSPAVNALCDSCSLLSAPVPLGAQAQSEESHNPAVNVTLMYEQVCRDTCRYSSKDEQVVLEGERNSMTYEIMNGLDFGSDGGWSVPHNLTDLTGPCNIKRRNATLTQLEFLEKFSQTEPVILEGISDQNLFKHGSSKWRLLSDYGQELITVATANTHSYFKTQMTLCDYVERLMAPQSLSALGNETLYHFGDNDRERWAPLFSLYQLPPYPIPGLEPVLSFGLAGPGSGVPFHIHGPTFAETIFGRKRWLLYPPDDDPEFNPDETTLHWMIHTLPSLPTHQQPLQCTLNPGEVCTYMYVRHAYTLLICTYVGVLLL